MYTQQGANSPLQLPKKKKREKSTKLQKKLSLKKVVIIKNNDTRGNYGRRERETIIDNISDGTMDDPTAIILNNNNTIFSEFEIKEGHVIAHGDIVLGEVNDFTNIKERKRVPIKLPNKWENNRVAYLIDAKLPDIKRVEQAISFIQNETNIKFVKRTNQNNFVIITTTKNNCYSSVGMQGGVQQLLLANNCQVGQIIHELVHVLGFYHEQNRLDRDDFILIYWSNIDRKNHPQFKKLPTKFVDIENFPFDFNSIMLYGPNDFAQDPQYATISKLNGEIYIPNKVQLSYLDIEKINAAYPPL